MRNPYKNFKHIKAFKEQKWLEEKEESDTEDDSNDPILDFVPFKCGYCGEYYELVYDEFHGEIVCKKCGCVIHKSILIE